jgi:hypothetical protein
MDGHTFGEIYRKMKKMKFVAVTAHFMPWPPLLWLFSKSFQIGRSLWEEDQITERRFASKNI